MSEFKKKEEDLEKDNLTNRVIINFLIKNKDQEFLLIKNKDPESELRLPSISFFEGALRSEDIFSSFKKHWGLELLNSPVIFRGLRERGDNLYTELFLQVKLESQDLELSNKDLELKYLSLDKLLEINAYQDLQVDGLEDFDNYEEKYQLALANYQNLLKRLDREKEETRKFALKTFLEELIPVYDHLKLSLKSLPEEEKSSAWVVGVSHVLKQFKETLEAYGVREIESLGQKFNHELMEAISGEGEFVVEEIMPGYELNGRVIRAAKVLVAKEQKQESDDIEIEDK